MSRNSGFRKTNVHVRGTDTGNAGLEVDSFANVNARGGKATAPTGRDGATGGKANGGVPINARMKVSVAEEVIDLGGASSVMSTNNLLPANSLILEIVTHCVEEFTTPTTYNVGDTTTGTRFATALANDTVAEGPAYASSHWAGTVAIRQIAAAKVKITPNAAGSGKVHVAVFYMQFAGGLI
jgi:hypothetical protein